jgi:hypothetical protein
LRFSFTSGERGYFALVITTFGPIQTFGFKNRELGNKSLRMNPDAVANSYMMLND